MSDPTELAELAEMLKILAPPNVQVSATDDGLRLAVREPRRMTAEVVVFALTLRTADWSGRLADIAASFDAFTVSATEISQHATGSDDGLALAQDIYNAGVALNPHGWAELFDFSYEDVAMDIGTWLGH